MKFEEQYIKGVWLIKPERHGDARGYFCESFKKADDIFMGNETFDVFREATIVGGRIDVCAESNSQRVVIENKINSGLNGIKPASSETQLNKYYEWALDKKMKPLCFITVPDARKSEISEEIKRFDTRNAGPVKMEEVFFCFIISHILVAISADLEVITRDCER